MSGRQSAVAGALGLLVAAAVAAAAGTSEPPHSSKPAAAKSNGEAAGRTFYVRQTLGDDRADGLSPETAWRSVARLSGAMRAGDTAYVGPGLYREGVVVRHGGTSEARLIFIADTSGRHTGDPPGPVVMSGAEPVDEGIFAAAGPPGVYRAAFDRFRVLGVVEMNGSQRRLAGVLEPIGETPYLERVAALPGSFYYDGDAGTLWVHTSDGAPPTTQDIELIRVYSGFMVVGKPYVTVAGFTLRHYADSGVGFRYSPHGVVADVVAFGSRQGVRVRDSDDVLVTGSTLFRNENSGVYFVQGSKGGMAIDNRAWENVKGIRWSSGSLHGVAVGNVLFDNLETGLSVEKSDRALLRGNHLAGNRMYQLMLLQTVYDSDGNCFERRDPAAPLVLFYPLRPFATLAAYQEASRQDLASREGGCGSLPERIDVHRLQAEAGGYAERARAILADVARAKDPAPSDG